MADSLQAAKEVLRAAGGNVIAAYRTLDLAAYDAAVQQYRRQVDAFVNTFTAFTRTSVGIETFQGAFTSFYNNPDGIVPIPPLSNQIQLLDDGSLPTLPDDAQPAEQQPIAVNEQPLSQPLPPPPSSSGGTTLQNIMLYNPQPITRAFSSLFTTNGTNVELNVTTLVCMLPHSRHTSSAGFTADDLSPQLPLLCKEHFAQILGGDGNVDPMDITPFLRPIIQSAGNCSYRVKALTKTSFETPLLAAFNPFLDAQNEPVFSRRSIVIPDIGLFDLQNDPTTQTVRLFRKFKNSDNLLFAPNTVLTYGDGNDAFILNRVFSSYVANIYGTYQNNIKQLDLNTDLTTLMRCANETTDNACIDTTRTLRILFAVLYMWSVPILSITPEEVQRDLSGLFSDDVSSKLDVSAVYVAAKAIAANHVVFGEPVYVRVGSIPSDIPDLCKITLMKIPPRKLTLVNALSAGDDRTIEQSIGTPNVAYIPKIGLVATSELCGGSHVYYDSMLVLNIDSLQDKLRTRSESACREILPRYTAVRTIAPRKNRAKRLLPRNRLDQSFSRLARERGGSFTAWLNNIRLSSSVQLGRSRDLRPCPLIVPNNVQ